MASKSAAGVVVGKGSVGESGPTAMMHYMVRAKTDILMRVETAASSLCGNTGAFALMFNNGDLVASGVITDEGDTIQATATPGDDIVVYVATFPIPNEIICVRLGDLYFNVIQHSLA